MSPGYLRVALGIFFLVNVVNYADRMVLSVLIEPIKAEFVLTDTQIGVLTGFAFTIFYALAGVALARVADRGNRINLVAGMLVVWSLMTGVTATAMSFWQLFLARVGVGVGESAVIPTANAVISDYFPAERRPGALAVFMSGATTGITAGMVLGGWMGEWYGWRWAFLVAAVPGLLLALVVRGVLREPPRGYSDGVVQKRDDRSIATVVLSLARNRSYLYLVAGASFFNFVLFGVSNWIPPYLVRRFDLSLSEVGTYFGVAMGMGSAVGALIGGFIGNRLVRSDMRWMTMMPAVALCCVFPLLEAAILAPRPDIAVWFVLAAYVVGGTAMGPATAAALTVIRPQNRATGSSLYGFSVSILGVGSAPLLVGLLSDRLAPTYGDARALQYAIVLAVPAALLGAWCYWRARTDFAEAAARARQ